MSFFFNEYTGPNRIQFTQKDLTLANSLRSLLPRSFFFNPLTNTPIPAQIKNIDLTKLLASDPSESIDSSSILPEFQRHFPKGNTRLLGGLVWFLSLRGLYRNFKSGAENELLRKLLDLDQIISHLDVNYMQVGCAQKI